MVVLRNRLYYRLKPFIPQLVRTAMRRSFARHQRKRHSESWPIVYGSERAPDGWPGWPGGKQFALVLTHDVETSVGLQRCRQLMELEQELGFRSSFNFVPEGEYRVPSSLRQELTRNGFEVGIHDLKHDGRLYASRREFSRKAERINHYLHEWEAVGFRSAFMLNELDWLHELDMSYDASTFDTDPFEPQPQGRTTIFPFWISPRRNLSTGSTAMDLHGGKKRGGYVELPYTLPQDSTLFLLLKEETPEIWIKKLDWLATNGGMALVITHPDYMSFENSGRRETEYPVAIYRQFLQYVRDRYAGAYWQALPKEVSTFTYQLTFPADVEHPKSGSNGAENPNVNSAVIGNRWRLRAKRAAVVLFSYYPDDPRPRRAAAALRHEGMEVDFICLQKHPSQPRKERTESGIDITRLPMTRERGGKWTYVRQYSLFIARAFWCLTVLSLRRRYDLVHVHNMPDVIVFSALVPKLLGAKIVLDLHDPVPELMQTIFDFPAQSRTVRLLKLLEKWSIAFADHVITVNEACKKIYSSRSCAADKITVVLNAPDEDVFCRPVAANGQEAVDRFAILYHGSILARNGFDIAVEALAKVRRSIPHARLVVCGEKTSFYSETMDAAAKRGLADHIEYLGPKNRSGVVDAISSCDVGIIPNRRNIFTEINTPTRIFECLALGKPVIAPQAQGIRDYFGNDDLIYFELGNSDDLARKIEFVYRHPDETKSVVERGQRIFRANSWRHQQSNLLNAISSLV
jgi:glycosyltransferase involved in cell wall biosynthesis